jgi:hypothetical protein
MLAVIDGRGLYVGSITDQQERVAGSSIPGINGVGSIFSAKQPRSFLQFKHSLSMHESDLIL